MNFRPAEGTGLAASFYQGSRFVKSDGADSENVAEVQDAAQIWGIGWAAEVAAPMGDDLRAAARNAGGTVLGGGGLRPGLGAGEFHARGFATRKCFAGRRESH